MCNIQLPATLFATVYTLCTPHPRLPPHFVCPGIIGALDPYTHKINTASLSGEGKLELEGVRPMRNNQTAAANIAASIISGAGWVWTKGLVDWVKARGWMVCTDLGERWKWWWWWWWWQY